MQRSNVDIIQRFQNKVLRNIVNAPWYIRNSDLHRDLEVDVLSSEIQRFAQKHEERWGHTTPGRHGHSAQTPEQKTFWASLSESVTAETVLVQVLVQEHRQC